MEFCWSAAVGTLKKNQNGKVFLREVKQLARSFVRLCGMHARTLQRGVKCNKQKLNVGSHFVQSQVL